MFPFTAVRQALVLYRNGVYRYHLPLQGDICHCKGPKEVVFAIRERDLENLPTCGPFSLLIDGRLRAAEVPPKVLQPSWPSSSSLLASEPFLR